MVDQAKLKALLHWLAAGAPPQTNYRTTVAELGRRMSDIGIAADYVGLYQITLNPLVGGLRYSWEPKRGVSVREFSHEQMTSNLFMDGVIDVSRNTRKLLRYRVGDTPEFDEHPGSRPIIEAGYSEFNVFPMQVITQDSSMFVVAVRREDGLPEDQFDACRRIVAPLARIVQSQMQTETNETLLATYLGKDAGARVSAGMVKRGDAEMIRAVVLFTDITGFTALSNRLPIDETVVILNRYFEALETPIMKNGGEVLKLMGDGMLAIFPTFDDVTAEEGAALSALSAVADAQNALADEEITFRSAYHIGEVHYGNIGGLNRLDFTAIGPVVNLTSRLLDVASSEKLDATCSVAFSKLVPERVRALGDFELKGFGKPQPVLSFLKNNL